MTVCLLAFSTVDTLPVPTHFALTLFLGGASYCLALLLLTRARIINEVTDLLQLFKK